MRRGEVWWADCNGRQAVVLLSGEAASGFSAMQVVAPADTDLSGVAVEVAVGAPEGLPLEGVLRVALPRPGLIPCTWLVTLAREDLIGQAGVLPSAKLSEIEDALRLGGLKVGQDGWTPPMARPVSSRWSTAPRKPARTQPTAPKQLHPKVVGTLSSSAYSPIPELNRLKEFEESTDGKAFSVGFELFEYGDVSHLGHEPPAQLLDRLIPFAQASHSGSFYALWKCDDRSDLAALPVIFCGDEGDLFIAARSLRELLRLLAVDDTDDAGKTPARDAYVSWLKHTFDLTPAEDAASLYDATLLEYGRAFCNWWLTFDDEDSIIADLLDELEELEGLTGQE